jgi:hypothetical protein
MRSVSTADDMEINVKSGINKKPKRVGKRFSATLDTNA